MDRIDQQILEELTRNPQAPFSRIAKRIGVSTITVQRRYKELKEEGIILRSSITMDLSKIGYQGKAILMVTNAPDQDKTKTTDALKHMKNVFIVTDVVGECDIMAVAVIKDFKNVIDLINEIRKIPSVDQVEVAFTTDTAFPVAREFNNVFSMQRD